MSCHNFYSEVQELAQKGLSSEHCAHYALVIFYIYCFDYPTRIGDLPYLILYTLIPFATVYEISINILLEHRLDMSL